MRPLQRIYAVALVFLSLPGCLAWAVGPVSIVAVESYTGFGIGALAVLFGYLAPMVARNDGIRPGIRRWVEQSCEGFVATGALVFLLTAGAVFTIAATPWTGALVDDWLAAPERWLGITQFDVRRWADGLGLLPMLRVVYSSLTVQLVAACGWWTFVGRDASRIWQAAATLALCILVGIPLYLLLPAQGPAAFYGSDIRPSFVEPWLAMRSGIPYTLEHIDGFVSAPSFHVIFSCHLVRLWWHTPLAGLAIALNTVMLLATWVVGWHYLTDLVLGAVVFGAAVVFVDWFVHRALVSRTAP